MGRKVAVALSNGVGIVATFDEVRHEGVMLSEISELGPRPTMFCPWGSMNHGSRARTRRSEPHGQPEQDEYYELYEYRERELLGGDRAGTICRTPEGLGAESGSRGADRAATDCR